MTNERPTQPVSEGARRLALRREREARWPPLFQGAFRPFFLCSAIWFPLALSWWVASQTGTVAVVSALGPIGWHRHELLFGGAGAAIAGYVLTATPNWSGNLPTNGGRLIVMLLWWCTARGLNALPPVLGPVVPTVVDTGFFAAISAACAREAWHSKLRGMAYVVLLSLLAVACAASHIAASVSFAPSRVATHAPVTLIVLLISVTAGRVVPSFTRNALPREFRGSVTAQQSLFDDAVHAITAVALLFWLIDDDTLARMALVVAALVQAMRLTRWGGWKVRHDPSVFALHIAYAWVPIGLAMLALAPTTQQSAALHALTAGAVPTMILAVMARVSITQTGYRPLLRHAPLISVSLVSVGTVLRVVPPWQEAAGSAGWIAAAVGLILGFCTFLGAFAPSLFRQRETAVLRP